MEKRKLGNINQDISLLGFGCMRLPKISDGSEDIDEAAAQAMVDFAMASGINYYDTAWIYHGGTSEGFIGNALKKYPRDSYCLADKLPNWLIKSPADVDAYFDKQLARCGVDYFDFYLVHAMNKKGYKKMVDHGVYEKLMEKKKRGQIRHLGFSFHESPQFIQTIVEGRQWDFAQIQLNYLDWLDIDAQFMYNYLTKKGIPVVVMEPVRGGALANLPDSAAKVLRDFNPEASMASWALRYVASLENVLTVLSGMSNMPQVRDNIGTFSQFSPLSDKEREVLMTAASLYRQSKTISCTGCRYCAGCDAGVSIPEIFAEYNRFCVSGNAPDFAAFYSGLGEKNVMACTACGACSALCPQQLDIPALLLQVKKTVEGLEV